MQQQQPWDIPAAISLYNIDRWGGGYFGVNESGNVQIFPTQDTSTPIDIMDLVAEAKAHGLSFPMVLRFQDLLRHRVQTINKAFASAIEEFKYGNVYRGVFPIKVNQLQEVVEEIMSAGEAFHFGIEAGSKPELLAAMAIHRDPESLIICNGYKDVQFIQNALLGTRLGKRVILVVEKLEELQQILTVAREVGVEPWVGVRVRLMAKGAGKWALSGGENAKVRSQHCGPGCCQRYAQGREPCALPEARALPCWVPGAGYRDHQTCSPRRCAILHEAGEDGP